MYIYFRITYSDLVRFGPRPKVRGTQPNNRLPFLANNKLTGGGFVCVVWLLCYLLLMIWHRLRVFLFSSNDFCFRVLYLIFAMSVFATFLCFTETHAQSQLSPCHLNFPYTMHAQFINIKSWRNLHAYIVGYLCL